MANNKIDLSDTELIKTLKSIGTKASDKGSNAVIPPPPPAPAPPPPPPVKPNE